MTPAALARSMVCSSKWLVSRITGKGFSSMIFWAALIPSMSARPTAIKMASGLVSFARDREACPLDPSPAISKPTWVSARASNDLDGK